MFLNVFCLNRYLVKKKEKERKKKMREYSAIFKLKVGFENFFFCTSESEFV